MVPWPAIRAESNGRVPDRERYLVRGGTYLTTVGGTSWSDVGLTASTLYSYTVAARDAAGNVSSQSSSAAATTGPASVTTTYTYDANGNQLSASDGTLTINATYDRLNRPLTVDDEDPGTTADTTYTYSLTSPSWTDPTGTYAVGLDRLDHATSVDGPAIAAVTRTYRADGRIASQVDPNGNTTAFSFDALGRELSRTTTAAGPVTRASLVRTYNRAGQVLTENSQISGDPTNGTTTYTYDPLERLTSAARSGMSTLAYTWDEVPNRLSVQTGAGAAVPTTYDAANRPTGQNGVSNVFSSDADGRLTAQPTAAGAAFQTYEWDSLGRLTRVRDAAGTTTIATYTYDPLDRLRMVDYGSSNRVRFRYVGLTTNAAQTIDDASGLVLRNIGTDWTGERMLDWTGTNSNIRYLGTNAHHDTVWTASSTGTVSATLRYDPFGTLTSSTGSTPDFRFQGSWFDSASSLSWVVTRWYAPALGRFLSEDSLLGTPNDPPSRHLYAYGAGEPIGRWDPDGRAVCHFDPEDCFTIFGRNHWVQRRGGVYDETSDQLFFLSTVFDTLCLLPSKLIVTAVACTAGSTLIEIGIGAVRVHKIHDRRLYVLTYPVRRAMAMSTPGLEVADEEGHVKRIWAPAPDVMYEGVFARYYQNESCSHGFTMFSLWGPMSLSATRDEPGCAARMMHLRWSNCMSFTGSKLLHADQAHWWCQPYSARVSWYDDPWHARGGDPWHPSSPQQKSSAHWESPWTSGHSIPRYVW